MSTDIILFYGHHAKTPGVVGKHVFSQWWPAPFTVDGITYPTAEHWMMVGKARMMDDEAMVEKILADPDPATAKLLGRHITPWDEAAWVGIRLDVVAQGNFHKFYQNKALGDFLVGTGNAVIAEASPNDKIWGIGMKADDPRALRPIQWDGLNLLGIALMIARADVMLKRHQDANEIADALNDAKGG